MGKNAKKLTAIFGFLTLAIAGLMAITGCETQHEQYTNFGGELPTNTVHAESILLREGDVVKITFPGAPNLNTTTPIRRDGNITLQQVGDVQAAGKTPSQLQADLLKLYADKLESKQILVEVASSAFPIFVTGAVLKPIKVLADHPMTALEAIMEAGGPDYAKANLKNVEILRQDGNHLHAYYINVKDWMAGKDVDLFYMKPGDIIYVREKFTWF